METYEIILDAEHPTLIPITCRAPSVVAVLRRMAGLVPMGQVLEVRSAERCLYRGPLPPHAMH